MSFGDRGRYAFRDALRPARAVTTMAMNVGQCALATSGKTGHGRTA